MPITATSLQDAFVYEPQVFKDARGYFFESFNQELFNRESGIDIHFVQDNQAKSSKNVLRGLHFQYEPHAQSKLIRVLSGAIWDVIVDVRASSPTFGKWLGIELSDENKKQLFVPKGFAHGYAVLTDTAEVFYKCDNFYHKESEGGIMYNDNELMIDWRINTEDVILSEKDLQWKNLKDTERLF